MCLHIYEKIHVQWSYERKICILTEFTKNVKKILKMGKVAFTACYDLLVSKGCNNWNYHKNIEDVYQQFKLLRSGLQNLDNHCAQFSAK